MFHSVYRGLRSFLPGIALTAMALPAIGYAQLTPDPSGTVIAIFNSKVSSIDVIEGLSRGEDYLVATGPFTNSFVIKSDVDGLPDRLKDQGAFLVMNYLGAAGCQSSRTVNPQTESHPFIVRQD